MLAPHVDEDTLLDIARLAGTTPDRVRAVYQFEWRRLEGSASIYGFIPLLALKHVREYFLSGAPTEKSVLFSDRPLNHNENIEVSRDSQDRISPSASAVINNSAPNTYGVRQSPRKDPPLPALPIPLLR